MYCLSYFPLLLQNQPTTENSEKTYQYLYTLLFRLIKLRGWVGRPQAKENVIQGRSEEDGRQDSLEEVEPRISFLTVIIVTMLYVLFFYEQQITTRQQTKKTQT